MFEFVYDTMPNVEAYLERMGYTGSRELTRETLNALVYTHQCNVPFDSMDCSLYHKPISLEMAHLFEKVVTHRRGGYCFELNGLFMALLRGMGFDAYSVMCRIIARKTELPPIRHRGTLVRLDGKLYFCDVGYGGAMAPFAVECSPEKQTFRGETYWITPAEEGWMQLNRLSGKGIGDDGQSIGVEQAVIQFAPIAFLSSDFQPYSLDCSTRPDSLFVTRYNATRRTPDGYITLSDHDLIKVSNGVKTVETIEEQDIPAVLKREFGIEPCEYTV